MKSALPGGGPKGSKLLYYFFKTLGSASGFIILYITKKKKKKTGAGDHSQRLSGKTVFDLASACCLVKFLGGNLSRENSGTVAGRPVCDSKDGMMSKVSPRQQIGG